MELRTNHDACGDNGLHLYYNTENRCWICFKCNRRGKGKFPGDKDAAKVVETETVLRDPIPLSYVLTQTNSITARKAASYLTAHHLDPLTVATRYELMLDDDWLVFPVYKQKKLLFWQKRNLFKKMFMNPSNVNKPMFWAREPVKQHGFKIAIVESYLNAVRLSKFVPTVCVFGRFISEEQAHFLAKRADYIYVALDAGVLYDALNMQRMLYKCGAHVVRPIVWLNHPHGTDFCDVDDLAIKELLL